MTSPPQSRPRLPSPEPRCGNLKAGDRDLEAMLSLLGGDEKHAAAASSTLDVLSVLYREILHLSPEALGDPWRDRFVLSKGHGPAAYYAVLAANGLLDPALLGGFGSVTSPLGLHPDRQLIEAVEVSSGSLGHGLPIAIGIALALRATGRNEPRVLCLLGDGECDEGSVHEAIALGGRERLDNLTAIVIDNSSSRWGWPGGIAIRFVVEGWVAETVDGRDHTSLRVALGDRRDGLPHVVVAEIADLPGKTRRPSAPPGRVVAADICQEESRSKRPPRKGREVAS